MHHLTNSYIKGLWFLASFAALLGLGAVQSLAAPGDLLRVFTNPTPASNDRFGRSVAVVGDSVLVGAYRDSTGATDTGAAYLFRGSTGVLLRTFLNPAPGRRDYFGRAVAAMGANVLVGAPDDDAGATDARAAYLFDGSTGTLLRTFRKPTPVADDRLGCTLPSSSSGGRQAEAVVGSASEKVQHSRVWSAQGISDF